jgi:hypothetical protein
VSSGISAAVNCSQVSSHDGRFAELGTDFGTDACASKELRQSLAWGFVGCQPLPRLTSFLSLVEVVRIDSHRGGELRDRGGG